MDQVIDAVMARALHADACRDHPLVAWVVWYDHPANPGRFIAQLTTSSPLPYLLAGDTLVEVQEQLPPGLQRFERQPVHPPEVVEIWFAK
jgi:predicted Zn-dependent protease